MAAHSDLQRPRRAFTLIELMVTIVVLAILLAIAVPSFQGMLDRKRVAGLAAVLVADIQLLRSEAIKRSAPVELVLQSDAYQLTQGDKVIKQVTLSTDHPRTRIAAPDAALPLTLTFDPTRERLLPGASELTVSGNSHDLQIAINPLGHTRICGDFGGYPAC